MRTSTTRADYIGERLEAIKAYSNERAEKDKALIEELMKALEPLTSTLRSRSRLLKNGFEMHIKTDDIERVRSLLSRAKEAGYG